MTAINVVQRLFQQHDLRSARRAVVAATMQQFPLRLAPALARLALPLIDSSGATVQLDALLASQPRLTIAGVNGSGRRLVLQQVALTWAATENAPFGTLLTLPLIDDGATPPHTLLQRWLTQTYPAAVQRLGPPHQPTRPTQIGWGLLFEGFEELPAQRQHVWRTMLRELPPRTPVIVAVAADEPAWDNAIQLTIAPLTPTLCDAVIALLMPSEQRDALRAALAPAGPLAPLGERLIDVALVSWAVHNGIPTSRANLYRRVVVALLGEQPAPSLGELQLLAAYDEAPLDPAPGLLDITPHGGVRFTYPLLRDFLAASQLVVEERYDVLHDVSLPAHTEIVRFAASGAADPTPLYTVLWSGGHPSPTNALALGHALRERPTSNAWTVRVAAVLARLARDGDHGQRAEARMLLTHNGSALAAALAAFARAAGPLREAVTRLLQRLPPDHAALHTARLVYADTTPNDMAWELADLLVMLYVNNSSKTSDANEHTRNATDTASDLTSVERPPRSLNGLARWAYVHALASPQHRARLVDAHGPAFDALAHCTAGDTRIIRAAAAVACDATLPVGARVAGLTVLGGYPAALKVIVQASHDPHPDVRHAAISLLSERSPQRSLAALRQTALNRDAPDDERRTAIRRVTVQAQDTALPARCARDTSLPLSARLECVSILASVPGSAAQLRDLAHDIAAAPFVRAHAAQQFHVSDRDAAVPDLLALLNDATTPDPLTTSICTTLAARGSVSAAPTLLALLERTTNVVVLLTAIHALGALRFVGATPHLRALLSEADGRLRSIAQMLDVPADAPLDVAFLPEPLGAALAAMLAAAQTAADQPTTLDELLRHEATRVRAAAAHALAAIGDDAARAALLDALHDDAARTATGEIVAALATLAKSQTADVLGDVLADASIAPLARWFAVQQLRAHPAGETTLLHALGQPTLDPFTRGAVAEALGQRGATAALPALRQLADDPASDEHARAQAILALGLLDDPTSEIALLRLVSTPGERDALRGLAAEHLPSGLSSEGRRVLRELLRTQRPPQPVIAGALRTLGRVHDREALPLLLRYAQEEAAAVAQAALLALADVGNASLAPALVRITQSQQVDAATRLQAVGTLLRIGGGDHMPLLRVTLEQGSLPLRLQALEHLLDTHPPPADVLPTLANPATPPTMRARLFQYCADDASAVPTLIGLLSDVQDDPYARGLAADALARHHAPSAVAPLAQIAASALESMGLRWRCIAALGALADSAAVSALDALADDQGLLTSLCRHAAQMLIDHAARLEIKNAE